jgi:hypothetical protein
MRRVRSQFLRPVARLGLVVRMTVATAALAAVAMPVSPVAAADVEERGFEMVSPDFMNGGARVSGLEISDDGNRVLYSAASAFAGAEGQSGAVSWYQAVRTPAGWQTTAMAPGGPELPGYDAPGSYSADLLRTLWTVYTDETWGTKELRPMFRQDDGHGNATWTPAAPRMPVGPTIPSVASKVTVGATAADLSVVVFGVIGDRATVNDGSTDTRVANQPSLHRIERRPDGSFEVIQLAKRSDGTTIAPNCNARVGGGNATTTSRGAADPSLSRVVIGIQGAGVCANAADSRVWVWVRNHGIVDVSASTCTDMAACGAAKVTNFEGGSRDVRRVYFTTAQKLTDGNAATGTDAQTADLYEYDFDRLGERLVPVTPGVHPPDVTPGTAGSGVNRVVRVSHDGSRAYFVANGRPLTGPNARGESPTPAGRNLYVYHRPEGAAEGTIKFVATLASNDSPIWGQDAARKVETGRDDGRYLYFVSRARLTADEDPGDTLADIFRYDAQTEQLQRVWRPEAEYNSANRTDAATFATSSSVPGSARAEIQQSKVISGDGEQIFFATAQSLDPADVNANTDGYVWDGRDGSIDLITGGHHGTSDAGVSMMTPDGQTFLFGTSTQLVPQHTSPINAVYVSRPGGGFAPPPLPPEPCVGDGCQGPGSTPPALPTAGSIGFSGDGNVGPPDATAAPIRVSNRSARGVAAKLKLRVPAAGRISVKGAAIRGASRWASKAGSYSVKVALKPRAKKRLRKNKKLTVAVRVSYRSQDGRPASKRVSVTFKRPKATKKKGGR